MNVPKLRFGEFEDEWQDSTLGDVSKVTSGGTPNRANNEFWNGSIPWVSTALIDFNVIKEADEFITEDGLNNSSAKLFPKNTLLMAMYGQGKTRGKVAILGIEAATNQACAAIMFNEEVDTNFAFHNLSGRYDEIRELSNAGSQENLSAGLIKELNLSYPQITEQQKIADFLSAVDEKITALTAQKTALTQYKQGMMQRIFAQTLRFKDDNGADYPEWEEMRLGDLLDYEQPTKYLVSSTDYQDDYPIPVLTAGKTFILGYTDEQGGIFTNLPVIIFDDFTTANKFVNFPFKAKSSAMKMLKNDPTNSNLRFIYETMQLLDFATGDEHKRYWISEYQEQFIFVPCLEEQTKIAQFLTELDNKINAVDAQIQSAQQWKQGLLQQMFV